MKSHNLLITIALLAVTFHVSGQEQPSSTVKRIRISDIFIQSGSFNERNVTAMHEDFQALAPQSGILNDDPEGFSHHGSFATMDNSMFSIMLGIQFRDQDKTNFRSNPLLRLGLGYLSGTTFSNDFRKIIRMPYDTLTSVETGQTYYIDSVTTHYYSMEYSYEQLRFDASLIFRTNPEERWSLFAGVGFTSGLSINASTDIYHSHYRGTETRNQAGETFSTYQYQEFDNSRSEYYRNKTNFGASLYIPLGIDFRLGKHREFWKQIHLFYEARPGINITSVPELRTIANASVQYGFGLRVSW
jgi:hypothetical protein